MTTAEGLPYTRSRPASATSRGAGGPFYRSPVLLLPGLLLALGRFSSSRALDWPMVLFMLLQFPALFFAENRAFVIEIVKPMLYIFATCFAVVAVANTPPRMVTILKIYLVGFIWYGIQGLPNGLVSWHPLMANEDCYGPLMVMGFGFAYYFGVGTSSRLWRYIAYATALLSCMGVVSSFARRAVLSFGLVMTTVWLRSQRKVRPLAAGVAAILVTLIAINVLFPGGEFWEGMRTISEGTERETGEARWVMWGMAFDMFTQNPLLGVGAGNFGPAALLGVSWDPSRPVFGAPDRRYNAALHNVYLQILCEQGAAGILLFAWMTVSFFQRLRLLRLPASVAAWRRYRTQFDLRSLSLALKVAMVGFLASAFFYNQIYIHWFWTLVALAFALTRIVESGRPSAPVSQPSRPAPPQPQLAS